MSIRERTSRNVSFDTRDALGDKIYKLTVMIDTLAKKDNNKIKQFKPQIYQRRGRGQNRGYSQWNYQNRKRIAGIEDSLGKTEVDPDLSKVKEGTIFGIMLEDRVDKIEEGSIKMITIVRVAIIEVGIGPERDHSQETIVATELEVQATVD